MLKVHGVGGLVLTSFPDLEKQGGNLVVESLLKGISFAAVQMNVNSFRNIYVQLDNCNSNKCTTFIVACALLVKMGICKKIKVNYLEVGHTHEDIDGLIGTVVTKLRTMDLPTFEKRVDAIKDALNKADAQIKAVDQIIGITDYERIIDPYFPTSSGIMHIKEFRITANDDGVPSFLYKSNSTIDGWYPRPFEKIEDFEELSKVFKHPDPAQGMPVGVNCYAGGSDKGAELGKRQYWFYRIRFAGGDEITFPLRCVGIRIDIPANISDVIKNLPVQSFSGPLSNKEYRDKVLKEVRLMLESRSDMEHFPTWEKFFQDLSGNMNAQNIQHIPLLHEIVSSLGGPVQHTVPRTAIAVIHEADLVPPLIVRGVTEISSTAERLEIIALRAERNNLTRLLGTLTFQFLHIAKNG
jgi:hypothetical protein